jgi:periplasmic divalent cation tolerance protein
MTEYVQVSTATLARQDAVELAKGAVQGRLAAGSQIIGPVGSVFWHLGEFGEGEEWRLLLTTTTKQYPQLEKYLLENPSCCGDRSPSQASSSQLRRHFRVSAQNPDTAASETRRLIRRSQ